MQDDPQQTVARNLRRLREDRGLTQDELGQRAAMADGREIRAIENEGRDPGTRVVVRLARALGVSIAALFDGLERP